MLNFEDNVPMAKIFIVDDDVDLLIMMKTWCEKENHEVTTYSTANNLLAETESKRPDMIFLDINLSGKDGRTICYNLKNELSYPVKIILFSADPIALLNFQELYADGMLNKPFEFEELDKKIKQHLRVAR